MSFPALPTIMISTLDGNFIWFLGFLLLMYIYLQNTIAVEKRLQGFKYDIHGCNKKYETLQYKLDILYEIRYKEQKNMEKDMQAIKYLYNMISIAEIAFTENERIFIPFIMVFTNKSMQTFHVKCRFEYYCRNLLVKCVDPLFPNCYTKYIELSYCSYVCEKLLPFDWDLSNKSFNLDLSKKYVNEMKHLAISMREINTKIYEFHVRLIDFNYPLQKNERILFDCLFD
jgi:hypothetical protein